MVFGTPREIQEPRFDLGVAGGKHQPILQTTPGGGRCLAVLHEEQARDALTIEPFYLVCFVGPTKHGDVVTVREPDESRGSGRVHTS